jgi:hypothetical protein
MKKEGVFSGQTQYKVERENSHRIFSTVQYIINLRGTIYRYVLYINEVRVNSPACAVQQSN